MFFLWVVVWFTLAFKSGKAVTARPWRRDAGEVLGKSAERLLLLLCSFVIDVVQYLVVFSLGVTALRRRGMDALVEAYFH